MKSEKSGEQMLLDAAIANGDDVVDFWEGRGHGGARSGMFPGRPGDVKKLGPVGSVLVLDRK